MDGKTRAAASILSGDQSDSVRPAVAVLPGWHSTA